MKTKEEKVWTNSEVNTIILNCWNAAREKKVPSYIKNFDDLADHITPLYLKNTSADKTDFKHDFIICVMNMHKYSWSYNWSNGFLKKMSKRH